MASELKEFLSTLKQKLNIIEVASAYISLERKGGNYWACCPFHHEKTPSFSLNESDQYYHCFGCGESGDVIKFVQSMENVEFMEAVRMLAARVHLEVPNSGFDSRKTAEIKRKKDAVLKILNETAHFYLDNLNSGKADKHVEYILQRKIPSHIVRRFGMGASLNFQDLPRYLFSKGYERQDIIDSGVVNETEGRLSDAQGGRLIFPIINAMDEVIAFGGRKLEKTNFAKYVNTRETIVFNKSKSLYNVNLLKKLKKTQTISNVIVVEGYMDTLSLYEAGFKNVVASMGTSLTQEQARLIKRYSDNVLISYDGDGAGQKANMRGLDILKSAGLNVKVVPLTDGLDPDDIVKKLGADEYRRCIDGAMPLIDYKLRSAEKGFDLSKAEDKRGFVAQAIKIIKTADSSAEREDLLKQLRARTGFTYESLLRDLEAAPVAEQTQIKPVERKDLSSATDRASRFVVASYLFGAKTDDDAPLSEIPFTNDVHVIIAKYLKSKFLLEERVQPAELLEFFDEGTEEYLELCRVFDYSDGDKLKGAVAEKYFFDCIRSLRITQIDAQISNVQQRIAAERGISERKALTAELQKLIIQKKNIKDGERK